MGLRLLYSKKKECDFLSSLEIVVVDQTDIILQQNWEHLLSLFDLFNLIPKKVHHTDFSRVKPALLDGKYCCSIFIFLCNNFSSRLLFLVYIPWQFYLLCSKNKLLFDVDIFKCYSFIYNTINKKVFPSIFTIISFLFSFLSFSVMFSGKYYRQTILLSAIQHPFINNLFSKKCFSMFELYFNFFINFFSFVIK